MKNKNPFANSREAKLRKYLRGKIYTILLNQQFLRAEAKLKNDYHCGLNKQAFN